jgi:Ni/Fe-hydrogenase 1 B-type cytochrome subunit
MQVAKKKGRAVEEELTPEALEEISQIATSRQSVYVWDLMVRITHWVNVLGILVLSITGYFIHNPYVAPATNVATNEYTMGWMRYVHFIVAFVFTINVLFRIYWSFAGSKYARWQQFVPTNRDRWRSLGEMIKYYAFLRKEPPAQIGHNPLAGMAYTAIHVLFLIQVITGFALFSLSYPNGFWPTAFGWINGLLGVTIVRLVHDVVMYLLIAFTIHHIYSAIVIEIEERSGLIGSIVTGYKSLTPKHIYIADKRKNNRKSKGLNGSGRPGK